MVGTRSAADSHNRPPFLPNVVPAHNLFAYVIEMHFRGAYLIENELEHIPPMFASAN